MRLNMTPFFAAAFVASTVGVTPESFAEVQPYDAGRPPVYYADQPPPPPVVETMPRSITEQRAAQNQPQPRPLPRIVVQANPDPFGIQPNPYLTWYPPTCRMENVYDGAGARIGQQEICGNGRPAP